MELVILLLIFIFQFYLCLCLPGLLKYEVILKRFNLKQIVHLQFESCNGRFEQFGSEPVATALWTAADLGRTSSSVSVRVVARCNDRLHVGPPLLPVCMGSH
jgi:hypothetical protein